MTTTIVVVGVCLYTIYLYTIPEGGGGVGVLDKTRHTNSNSNGGSGRSASMNKEFPSAVSEMNMATPSQYNDAFPGQSRQMNRISNADDAHSPDVGSQWQEYILSQ